MDLHVREPRAQRRQGRERGDLQLAGAGQAQALGRRQRGDARQPGHGLQRGRNIGRGEQFEPAFLALSPNNRIPAITDHSPADGGPALSIFESGAILLYLAEKTGRLMPTDLRGRAEVMQWLMWQMGGLGPMAGQAHHWRQVNIQLQRFLQFR